MDQKKVYFRRGILRIGAGVIVISVILLAFNLIGYVAITYNLPFIPDPNCIGSSNSYIGRVFELVFIGGSLSAMYAAVLAGTGFALYLLYQVILYIGGYR
jgi:hypothetical protein